MTHSAKPLLLGFVITLFMCTCASSPQSSGSGARKAETSLPLSVVDLAPGIVVVSSEPWAVNSLLVRGKSGQVILVDTPATPEATNRMLDMVYRRWQRLPDYAINSHWHADATAGNQVLLARGVVVITTRRTASALEQRGAKARAALVKQFSDAGRHRIAAAFADWRPTPGNRIVEVTDRLELTLGNETVVLIYPGPSHSGDSIAVFFPASKVLYGGCAVRSNGRIGNLSEADLPNWIAALRKLAALAPNYVVPGHGSRFSPAMLEESITAVQEAARTSN